MLNSVEHDGVQIEVCAGCQGEWLHAGELQIENSRNVVED